MVQKIQKSKSSDILALLTKYTKIYIDDRKAGNVSKNTIYNANIILERFYDYIADELADNANLSLKDINRYFINNYLNYLSSHNLNKNTQKLHLTVIKGVLSFIADSDIEKYGFIKLGLTGLKIKTEQKEKESLSQGEQKQLVDYIKQLDKKGNYLAHRNSLLIKVLLYTGVRISELINIKWSDISEYEDDKHGLLYTILVKGKGDKERYVYMAYDLIADNIEYIKEKLPGTIYLFTSTHGTQCNRSVLFNVVKGLFSKLGINKTGIHIFRHTFARNLVDKDVNLSTIKDLLGHSNISVTAQFYAKSNENAKRNALFRK